MLRTLRRKTDFARPFQFLMNRLVLFLLASLALGMLPGRADERPPNIVIIFIDDMGYADIGPFGAKGYPTPNLDRMAAEGRKFTNFHVPQPVCSASRAGLLTGCYPNRIGIHGALGPKAPHGIAASEMTLAELLKQKGYATGMAGKWHLGDAERSFCRRTTASTNTSACLTRTTCGRSIPRPRRGTYPPLPLIEGDQVIKSELGHEDQNQLTTQYTERAVKFIERNKDRPFFFYLAHSMPHVPLHVSDKFHGKSEQGLYGDG